MAEPAARMEILKVRILRIWDTGWYPGMAECRLVDAFGVEHRFQDKIPVFSQRELTQADLPCDGAMRCTRLRENPDGSILIDTECPDDIESLAGESRFSVFPSQLADGAFL